MFSPGSYSLLSNQTNHAFLTNEKPAKYDVSIKINKILQAHAFHITAIKVFVSQSGVDADSEHSATQYGVTLGVHTEELMSWQGNEANMPLQHVPFQLFSYFQEG